MRPPDRAVELERIGESHVLEHRRDRLEISLGHADLAVDRLAVERPEGIGPRQRIGAAGQRIGAIFEAARQRDRPAREMKQLAMDVGGSDVLLGDRGLITGRRDIGPGRVGDIARTERVDRRAGRIVVGGGRIDVDPALYLAVHIDRVERVAQPRDHRVARIDLLEVVLAMFVIGIPAP